MGINFYPYPGQVLICDFSQGFKPPEMVKKRLVVVITPRRREGADVCTVVPLSAKEPEKLRPYHVLMNSNSLPEKYRNRKTWAKCDMVTTVAHARLDRIFLGKDEYNKRMYSTHMVTPDDWPRIKEGVRKALGI